MLGFYPLSADSIAGMQIASINNLQQHVDGQLSTQEILLKQVYLQSDILLLETITVNLDIYRFLESSVSMGMTVYSSLQNIVIINLGQQILLEMSAIFNSVFYINSEVDIKMLAYPNLDVNNNTMGSPGGVPVDGFYPPNNVIFILTSEDSAPVTKTVTSQIGDFTGFSITNSDLINVVLNDSVAEITVKTPYSIGETQQTFISTKLLTPQQTAYEYTLKFDSTILQIKQQRFDIDGIQNAEIILDGTILYARNESYSTQIGELKYGNEIRFYKLSINSTEDIIIEARCDLQNIPSPEYYQTIINTRVVNDIDKLAEINLISQTRTASAIEQCVELSVGQITVLYKIMVLPNFTLDKNKILETVLNSKGMS